MEAILFDGAMGTMLQKSGLKLGENPEVFNIKYKEIIKKIHRDYINAGATVITTNTFGANELKLKRTGYEVEEIIEAAVNNAKEAIGNDNTLIALDIGPIGQLLEPMGTLSFDSAYEIFKRQVKQGVKSGADIILIETMTDLYEAKAAVLAAKENSDLPVFCTMSFESNGRTFVGCTPESMVMTLEGLGVDAIGINCSLGPKELKPILERILNVANVKVMVQPNAGLPSVVEGITTYNISVDEFSDYIEEFMDLGVAIVGGCCGTTPHYINMVRKKIDNKKIVTREYNSICGICTPSKVVNIDGIRIVGERINPTGKKLFKQALIEGDFDYILDQAIEQVEAGAHILDVNVGLPEINEEYAMLKSIRSIQEILDVPLQIDSSNNKVIEVGLRYYNGKAIVNSVNGEDEVLDKILPIVKKYGAAVVGLTLDNKGIPNKAEERFKIAEKILNKALSYGIKKEDVFIDCLVLTASAQQEEVKETLRALRLVKEKLGVKTLLGVSNISFGLPNRNLLNETFLSLALGAGLDLPIMNPNSNGMMDVVSAFNLLYNYDKGASNFIEKYGQSLNGKIGNITEKNLNRESKCRDLKELVIKGLKDEIEDVTKELLKNNEELVIVNEYLVPALDVVGKKFENGEIFLPQLISSAEAVQKSFKILKESLVENNKTEITKGKIILATVKGDIHDIGKNIVKVILENYGYDIIDLGKDVAIEKVVEAVKINKVSLVGLSALMTTTLKSMEDTITALKENNINTKIFVGGAVLTEGYSKKIGADFYAKDAKEAVNIARFVLGK